MVQWHKRVTVNATIGRFDSHLGKLNIYNLNFFAVTQHAMPREFGKKWGTECVNIRFPLSILQYAKNI